MTDVLSVNCAGENVEKYDLRSAGFFGGLSHYCYTNGTTRTHKMSIGDKLLIIAAKILDGKISNVRPFTLDGAPDRVLTEVLSPVLGYAFTVNPSGGFTLFSDWENITIYQNGAKVDSTTTFGKVDRRLPLICIHNEDESLPSEVVAMMLTKQWAEEQEEKEAQRLAERIKRSLASSDPSSASTSVLTSQERHWLPPAAVVAMKRFFYAASCEIARRVQTNPTRREEGLTSELVFEIFSRKENQEFLHDLLSPHGIHMHLSCEESGSAEPVTGADLGMCLSLIGRGLKTMRAILLQAKRLHQKGSRFSSHSIYGDMFAPHGLEQAKRMLGITPASFFILYNPEGLSTLLPASPSQSGISSSLDYSVDGISILPASYVIAMDRAIWEQVGQLHFFTCSFIKFMVDDFVQGKIGDCRPHAIRAALTRSLRDILDPNGSGQEPLPRFSVHISVDISHMHLPEVGHG
jgi:uncharacterized protein (DUF2132 family)